MLDLGLFTLPVENLPVLQEVDLQVRLAGLVERDAVDKAEAMAAVLVFLIGDDKSVTSPRSAASSMLVEEKAVITGLDREEIVQIMAFEFLDVRGIGAQGILGDNDLQMRMLAAQVRKEALGGIALAVILGRAVLPADHLRTQGDETSRRSGWTMAPASICW